MPVECGMRGICGMRRPASHTATASAGAAPACRSFCLMIAVPAGTSSFHIRSVKAFVRTLGRERPAPFYPCSPSHKEESEQ